MHRHLLATAVHAALGAALIASPAHAQDPAPSPAPTEIDKVTVTGSLIPRTEIETATPVISISAENIKRQGFKDVYDVLRAQPLATGAVQDSQFIGGFTTNAEPISLLGLDPGFTLVLIDGRPMADYPLLYNGQSNFTDLASIPTAMVERIDIAPGNQSAIYGSSAIAGVVNIILKKRIDGTHLNLRFGGYDQGGGESTRLQLIGGKSFGELNLTYGLQYSMQDPIYGYDRRRIDSTNDNPDPEARYGTRNFVHINADVSPNQYIDPGVATCASLGNLFNGTIIRDFRPNRGYYCGSREDVGYATVMNRKRDISGYLNASYPLNDKTELYGTLLIGRNKSEANPGTRIWTTAEATNGLFLNDVSGQFETYQRIFAPEETGDVDANNERQTSDSYNLALGSRGGIGDSAWNYDAYFGRSQYTVDSKQLWLLGAASDAFFEQRFLGPVIDHVGPYPVYAPGDDSGFYRPLTPAEYASISDVIHTKSETWTQNFNLQLTNTELFNLPAGAVGFAAVLQAGEQSWKNPTDPRVVNGDFFGLTGTQGEGKRRNQAVGLEFRVPIFSQLTASVSGRYDKYKNVGAGSDSDGTYKIGLEYRPVSSLLLRANYATAFKAPDMAYVFAGDSGYFTSVVDYYRCATEEPGESIGNCTYNGESVSGQRSGAKDLKSITAKSWGAGIMWAPSGNFDVSVDYYNIKIDDEVNDLNIDAVLRTESACRQGQLDIASPSCVDALARITRLPADAPVPLQLDSVRTNPINVSKEEVQGLTAKLNYRWETERWGNFALGANYNVTLKHENQQYPGDPVIDYLRDPFYSSEFHSIGSASLSWMKGPWTTTLYGTRYGRTPNYASQIDPAGYSTEGGGRMKPYVTFNGSTSYEFGEDVSLSFTVNNLFNKMPDRDETYTAYPYFNNFNYNIYGRSFMVEVNWRFGAGSQ
ncbi:TonB-dependent receptor [Lysobacter capsici]|uniref:TonB-dependent receptor plug domain-containing protein n=1 Tax=Lysobacter capsici TaxID=435897 RepID=UPI00177D97B6|nr:TonB-dependent receptor [Lysobacter capsici]UOF14717.1 TonB-dependent receptor [Lysobacter capsici]